MRFLLAVLIFGVGVAPAWGQPRVRTLTEQELVDMMLGSSIQASRGNNTESMVKRIKDAIAEGRTFTMISLDEVPDDWRIVSGGGIGGGGAWEHVRERTAKQKLPTIPNAQARAVEALGKHLGIAGFNAVVRVEAAGATLTALMLAADLGLPIVDACMSGRARPEVQQSIPWINGIHATPAAFVTRWGDIVILARTVDDYRMEDLGRAIAVASGGGSAGALSMSGRDLKRGVIPGSVSEAIRLGRTVREARAQARDPIDALVTVTNGYKLFQGIVTRSEDKGDRGFSWSDVEIRGTKEFAGHTYRVFVKNENNVTWLDGKPDAMAPDFIANLDPKTGDTINPPVLGSYVVDQEVVLVGWPNSAMWRTPRGIEVFGPRHFGFDFDYVPIEQLQKARMLKPRQ
jgi:DUF917 family protein